MKWTPERYLKFALHIFLMVLPVIIFLAFLNYKIPVNPLFLLIVFALTVRIYFRTSLQSFMTLFGQNDRVSTDISDQNPPVTDALQPYEETLYRSGFERSSQSSSRIPMEKREIITWEYVSWNDMTYAELVDLKGKSQPTNAAFTTWFDGPRLVITRYPIGMNNHSDDIHESSITDSLDAAYNYHLQQVALFRKKYGEPIMSHTALEREQLYRANYSATRLHSTYYGVLWMFAALKLGIASAITTIYFLYIQFFRQEIAQSYDGAIGTGILLSIVISILSFIVMFNTARLGAGKTIKKSKE